MGEKTMQFPDTKICVAAMELARDHSPAYLFNHVMRSHAFGRAASEARILGFRQGMR